MVEGTVWDLAELLREVVDGLLGCDLTCLSGVEAARLAAVLEVQRRRVDAVDVRVVADLDDRGVAGEFGRTSTADLLAHSLRVTPYEARQRVARARDLGPRRELTGALLEPILPATSAALTAGEISTAHTTVIADCLDAIPTTDRGRGVRGGGVVPGAGGPV